GESFYNPLLGDVVSELRTKGLLVESDGAMCVFPPGFTAKDGSPLPLIVRKKDGGDGDAATRLAAIPFPPRGRGGPAPLPRRGAPQQEPLAMVFAVARMAGWLPESSRAEHVAFGSVLGEDKKMFKTRSGETVKLSDLVDEAVGRAEAILAEKNPELDAETKAAV